MHRPDTVLGISQRREAGSALQCPAYHDSLPGLPQPLLFFPAPTDRLKALMGREKAAIP